MIDLVNSQCKVIKRIRNKAFPFACEMAELLFTDTPALQCKYAEHLKRIKFYLTNSNARQAKVEARRIFVRELANREFDPINPQPIKLSVDPAVRQFYVINGNHRFATLLALGRPALAAYPWEWKKCKYIGPKCNIASS